MIYSLAITGPTASGKTALSIEIARTFDAEIISCDSMQIYKEMNIGTAKATQEERAEVRHHMLDFLSPGEDYSAQSYRTDAMRVAKDIQSRGKLPMFVGGTGLYIDTLMRAEVLEVPESSKTYRDKMLDGIKSDGDVDRLFQRLCEIDPESAEKTHKNNIRRVIRALEIYDATGKTKSYFDRISKEKNAEIKVGMITLDVHDRENLYKRIDRRVDEMISEGLVEEVSSLYNRGLLRGKSTAAQAIGYKEIVEYLDGEISLEEAVELIKLSSRRYAKRQITWFKHEEGAYRLYLDTEEGVMRSFDDILCEAKGAAEEYIKGFI